MIIGEIKGGLGNQLFQYAMVRALSLRTGQPFSLDIGEYSNSTFRKFDLGRYALPLKFISGLDKWLLRLGRIRLLPFPIFDWAFVEIKENQWSRGFEAGELKGLRRIYLSGYWQSEKYFADAAPAIRADFRLAAPPSPVNEEMLRKIEVVESVALHVRRGDYVNNPATASFHGHCGLEYYRAAMRKLEERVSAPHYFVFSDDIPWVKINLKSERPMTLVEHNQGDPCEDLRLMASCRHFIIANSSFSWWGAWLSDHDNKVVIAPKRWFLSENTEDRDLVPPDWIRI